jgi:hypothetical protein
MDEQPTTDSPVAVDGATEAQPVPATDAPAATPAEPTEDKPEPSQDENLAWLQNKGIDPQSPEALAKVAEMYRNAEKTMHQSTAKASELEKTLTTQDPAAAPADSIVTELAAEVQRMKLQQNVNSFWSENPDAKAYEAKMTDIVTSRPDIGTLVRDGYLSLGDLYSLARGGDSNKDAELKAAGGKEALEKVAEKQQAKAVPGVATSSALSDGTKVDPFLIGLTNGS